MPGPLKQRIITGAIMAVLLVAAVWYLPTPGFALVTGLVTCAGAWEWAGLAGLRRTPGRFAYVAVVFLLLLLMFILRGFPETYLLPAAAVLAWCLVLLVLVAVERDLAVMAESIPLKTALGLVVLVPGWLSLVLLHRTGPDMLLLLIALVAAADIGAYFAGRRWGRTKLAPRISPGKTWQGLCGGVACAALVAAAYGMADNIRGLNMLIFLFICLITVLASVLGDLLESLMKRSANCKNSGNLLPGHGGVLDRIDGLTAAAPVFLTGRVLWGLLL